MTMKKWLFMLTIVAAVGVWQLWLLYDDVFAEQNQAAQQAAQTAEQKFDLSSVENVSFYHGNEAYFVVKGTNSDDKATFVWIPQGKGGAFAKPADEGWSRQRVEEHIRKTKSVKKFIDIRPGVLNNVPVWEIIYIHTNGRYIIQYVTFENGEDISPSYSIKRETF
jgi:uncharacterized protein YpmB